MRLHEHVLPKEMVQGSKEKHCAEDLLKLITKQLKEGKIEAAKLNSIDLTKSLHELSKMKDRKRTSEKYDALLSYMGFEGERARRYYF